jgi:urea-proton symporter
MGVILGGAVVPISLCITSARANKWGCVLGAVCGFAAGIIAWLVTTSTLNDGVINVTVSFYSDPSTICCNIMMIHLDEWR